MSLNPESFSQLLCRNADFSSKKHRLKQSPRYFLLIKFLFSAQSFVFSLVCLVPVSQINTEKDIETEGKGASFLLSLPFIISLLCCFAVQLC